MVRLLLAGAEPAAVISSPRQRASTTAELAGFTPTELNPDAAEWDYGDYEGLTSAQIHQSEPTWSIWDGMVPNGEDAVAVRTRIDRLLAHAAGFRDQGPVLVFSHGHASRCIAARWLGDPISTGSHYKLGTGAVSGLDFEHGRPVILHWNLDTTVTEAVAAAQAVAAS
jgi:broad specificity phosphatase PhoE